MSDRYGEAERLVAMEDRYLGIEWYKAAKGQMRRLLARTAELESELEAAAVRETSLSVRVKELEDAICDIERSTHPVDQHTPAPFVHPAVRSFINDAFQLTGQP